MRLNNQTSAGRAGLKITTGGGYKRIVLASAVFAVAFVATMLASSIFVPQVETNADRIRTIITSSGYFMDVSSTQDLTMSLTAVATGKMVSAKDTVNVKSNVPAGYKLYLSMDNARSNGNRLNKDGMTDATDYFAPVTGTLASPATLANNTWGFALSKQTSGVPDNGFDEGYAVPGAAESSKWAAVPLNDDPQLIQTVLTADEDDGIDTDVYYAVKADTSLPAGTYSGVVVYTAVSDASGMGDTATIAPSVTEKLYGGETLTITTSLATTETDLGVINVYIGETQCANAVGDTSTGVLIITCTSPAHSSGLYDVKVGVEKFGKVYNIGSGIEYRFELSNLEAVAYMQNMTHEICAAVPTPAASTTDVPTATLIDTRDEKTYKVAKLADGNCWMIDNLRLGKNGEVYTLTEADTDLGAGMTFSLPSAQNGAGGSWAQNDTIHLWETNNVYYGNYYNWYTATAGSGVASMAAVDADWSICPKGWRLPPVLGTNSFQNLVNVYGATNWTKIQAAPISFVPAGYVNANGGIEYVGTYGGYWSASATTSSGSAYSLRFYSSGVYPQDSGSKQYGFSVRCVAR